MILLAFRMLMPSLAASCLALSFLSETRALEAGREPEEGAPVFFLEEVIPNCACKQPSYWVRPIVEVDDFRYAFQVESDFGKVVILGVENLREYLHELEVIESLQEIGQTEAFAKTLSKRFTDPVMTTFGVARRPISTVTGLPGGITRYIGGKLYQVSRTSRRAMDKLSDRKDEEEEQVVEEDQEKVGTGKRIARSTGSLSRKHLGYDSSKRKWARQFGVDPYSSNPALQEELGRIAWASSFGDFAGDFVVPASEVVSYAGKARELVWDTPAHLLEQRNEKLLKKLSVSKDVIQEFMDTDALSLTEKTQLCAQLESLSAVEGCVDLVEIVLEAKTYQDIGVLLDTIKLLEQYQSKVAPLASISLRQGMLSAVSENGYLVLPIAADFLHWTPVVSTALTSDAFKAEKREIWISGQVSGIAESRLRHYGWEVFQERDEAREALLSLSEQRSGRQ
ncbi:hypothetical protein [Pelagicoccus sp. SDUM812003]|uniref:hypothetical protein n=1 Tax=Pelagicoccus sp. SDUM812003 TaxID=3041267 RepID=UPI00281031AA|nr:hypothetical protein [Pelagicoccus sp. SDUM812003]MDQ8203756.1 hypothetical protein [Pelagicoccus sp. SDUM812003]